MHFVVTLLIATRFIRGSIVAPFQKKTIASFVYGCFSRNLLIDEKRFEFHPNWKNVPLSSRVTGSVCWMKKGKKGEEKKRSRTIFVFFSSTFFFLAFIKKLDFFSILESANNHSMMILFFFHICEKITESNDVEIFPQTIFFLLSPDISIFKI